MFNIRLTEVVKNLIIINVLFFIGTYLLLGDQRGILAMYRPFSANFEPYQIVTHMFMHGDVMHLAINMFVLAMFGPPIETLMGPRRFLIFYFVTGLGAVTLHFGLQFMGFPGSSVWGASGAIAAVFTAYGLSWPRRRVMLLIPPIPMKAITMVAVFVGIDLVLGLLDMFGIYYTGVAHFAHLGGVVTAFILLEIWYKISGKL